MTRWALAVALALGIGVAVRPSTGGAAATVAIAALAAVCRRQDSADLAEQKQEQVADLAARLTALRDEFDRVKLMVPRPK